MDRLRIKYLSIIEVVWLPYEFVVGLVRFSMLLTEVKHFIISCNLQYCTYQVTCSILLVISIERSLLEITAH